MGVCEITGQQRVFGDHTQKPKGQRTLGKFDGKVALVVGGANGNPNELMGFGGAAAWMLMREGASIVLADISDEKGEESAELMREAGGDASYIHLDVTSPDDWESAMEYTVEKHGGLNIMVYSAGFIGRYTIATTSLEEWEHSMGVNLTGVFLGLKAAEEPMAASGGGSIINLSSVAGLRGGGGSPAYHASKAAVRNLTKVAAISFAEHKIRVNSVHPGFARTPFTDHIYEDPEVTKARLSRVPMGELMSADEVAYGIVYLASDESRFVTGTELVIDGGMTA